MGMPRKCQERLTGPGIAVLGPRQQKARLGGMRGARRSIRSGRRRNSF